MTITATTSNPIGLFTRSGNTGASSASSNSSSSSGTTSTSNSAGSDIASLEKQIRDLQSQIQKENTSKDDSKTKTKIVAELENEIQMLEAEITEKRAEQAKTANRNQTPTGHASDSTSASSVSSSTVSETSKTSPGADELSTSWGGYSPNRQSFDAQA
jgi:TolA-binding protein